MNARFSDYVTSGAFTMSLTRSQIAGLALLAGGEERYLPAASALERKGLAEPLPERLDKPGVVRPEQMLAWRMTSAGAIVLNLLFQAGLTNCGQDALAAEADDLRAQLAEARRQTHDAFVRMKSLRARLGKAELTIEQMRAQAAGEKLPVRLVERDWLPDVRTDDLLDPETRLADRIDPAVRPGLAGEE